MGENGWQPLFETALEVDEEAAMQRGNEVVGDRDVSLLGRVNRIALSLGQVVPLGPTPDATEVGYDIPLHCVVHPHSGCSFRSAKLVVDLTATPRAVVRDMAPREVRGESPVELTTTVGTGLTLEVVPSVLKGEVKREHSAKQTVHHPIILSSGRGFSRALWDFRSVNDTDLQPERELRLLVTAPPQVRIVARFNLRAQVTLGRAGRLIPLARRKSEIDQTYLLADWTQGAAR
jgi:hypothetical protein